MSFDLINYQCNTSNNVLLLDCYRVLIKHEGGMEKLVLNKLKRADEGVYSCKVGDRETKCELVVNEGTHIKLNTIIVATNTPHRLYEQNYLDRDPGFSFL